MIKIIFIVYTVLTLVSVYATYTGSGGLQEVVTEPEKSIRSSHSGSSSYSSGGSWGYGK